MAALMEGEPHRRVSAPAWQEHGRSGRLLQGLLGGDEGLDLGGRNWRRRWRDAGGREHPLDRHEALRASVVETGAHERDSRQSRSRSRPTAKTLAIRAPFGLDGAKFLG